MNRIKIWPPGSGGWTRRAASLTLLFGIVMGLFALNGCSTFSSSVKLKSVTLDVVSQANDDTPIAVDFAVVNDAELLKLLQSLPAGKWFEQRDQFLRDYPLTLKIWSHELVPSQHVEVAKVPIAGESAVGLLVFAGYAGPGAHRLNLGVRKTAWLRFESKDVRLVEDAEAAK
ncbi:hypothetical protein [Andreprevotia chitinilytica]|uniref:hypothetical protein n=1 Tax=Andreprevotia chitinilytica TaxID=396808 RepID=UPI000AC61ECE|nr:hypothetical protein [Andreprevotia chitinilytica]